MVMVKYSNELYHYGIKGQKWGIRKYQNPDGTLTEEGKRRYLSENARAMLLGGQATFAARNKIYSEKRLSKAQRRYNRKRDNAKRKMEYDFAVKYNDLAVKQSAIADKKVHAHYDSLVKRFGKENISNINLDRRGNINEFSKNDTRKGYVKTRLGKSLGSAAAYAAVSFLLGGPVGAAISGLSQLGWRAMVDKGGFKSRHGGASKFQNAYYKTTIKRNYNKEFRKYKEEQRHGNRKIFK